jgi:single-stranded DNA-binding protein
MSMSVNRVILCGAVGQYGCKITWTEQGKPHTSFMLVYAEPGRDGAMFRTFIPVLCIGPKAESLAESLEPDDLVLIDGKLTWKAGKTKDSGKLVVVCFGVDVLTKAPALADTAGEG